MAKETKARVSYTLDPDVDASIRAFAKDMDVPTSEFVNYYFRQVIHALETAEIQPNYNKAKAVFANNKSVLYAGGTKIQWNLCINFEFHV